MRIILPLLSLAIVALGSGIVTAQPAQVAVADCVAFEIHADAFCCYAFTLCVTNYSLPPITDVHVARLNSIECAAPETPDGWSVVSTPASVDWTVDDPIDAIPPQATLCGFTFTSTARASSFRVTLTVDGNPVFETQIDALCDEDCVVPREPGTWGRIKAIYAVDRE
jgi:hypothetical protein